MALGSGGAFEAIFIVLPDGDLAIPVALRGCPVAEFPAAGTAILATGTLAAAGVVMEDDCSPAAFDVVLLTIFLGSAVEVDASADGFAVGVALTVEGAVVVEVVLPTFFAAAWGSTLAVAGSTFVTAGSGTEAAGAVAVAVAFDAAPFTGFFGAVSVSVFTRGTSAAGAAVVAGATVVAAALRGEIGLRGETTG